MTNTMKKVVFNVTVICLLLALAFGLTACGGTMYSAGKNYTIPQIDLSVKPEGVGSEFQSLYDNYVVDDGSDYMAHPDATLLPNNDILLMFPEGHGKGKILARTSTDGKVWSDRLTNLPESFANSQETPTVYKLDFTDGSYKYVVTSANPSWGKPGNGGGWNAATSEDGLNWTEFQEFYGKKATGKSKKKGYVVPIVAMASLTQLKDSNGNWTDSWMGFFHDDKFFNYKSILTFDTNGQMQWSMPEKYFASYRKYEKGTSMCEVEVIRSDNGQGNTLCLLTRSNGANRGKYYNSLLSFSHDEGKTWSKPVEAPAALSGERLKADYLQDGRLVITFRSIERDSEKYKLAREQNSSGKGKWFSEGWIAWVGTFADLENGNEGQYRIKLAHTYLSGQSESEIAANGDTGYCGNVVLPNGDYVTTSYGRFSLSKKTSDNKDIKTYITSKRINFTLMDELYELLK